AYAGARTEEDRGVELEDVVADKHGGDHRDCGRNGAPYEETDADFLQAGNEAWPGGDPDTRDEHVQPERVEQPEGGTWNAAEDGTNGAQPAEHQPRKQRAAGRGQADRDAPPLVAQGANEPAEYDAEAQEGNIGRLHRTIRVADLLDGILD